MNPIRILTLVLVCLLAAPMSGCFKPPRGMPDESVIGFDGKNAVPPDCTQLARRSLLTDAGLRRPAMQWGCATYTNLAAQVANPQDLVAPRSLAPADAAVAASAVRRYEAGQLIPLDTETSTSRRSK
ncbi:CpaD family pilus assembly lipoprotein [Paraburkholderia rhynchosiae]|uniref:Lipoprotein n=1 Tax=Paraburkholderia rhynchosiae TaxID=487049 RepID=A0A2N7WVF7_9BURK|nr:CpaD family pilus assembly lipoprotein [Paraburkholderia rhynchosiae]PMS33466.1 hypothetical protein C0Z16_02455 [Paraburkholderia rhynchosiae]CAB3681722.1 hypothetical protein LMG27174_02703 [Paraburkholderia rhynchosiae]